MYIKATIFLKYSFRFCADIVKVVFSLQFSDSQTAVTMSPLIKSDFANTFCLFAALKFLKNLSNLGQNKFTRLPNCSFKVIKNLLLNRTSFEGAYNNDTPTKITVDKDTAGIKCLTVTKVK